MSKGRHIHKSADGHFTPHFSNALNDDARNAVRELRIMIELNRTSVFRETVLALITRIERGL
jgi:hypothetical protein